MKSSYPDASAEPSGLLNYLRARNSPEAELKSFDAQARLVAALLSSSEVKALAEQTARATAEIGTKIDGIQAATQDWVSSTKDPSSVTSRLRTLALEVLGALDPKIETLR